MSASESTGWYKRTEYDRTSSETYDALLAAAERVFAEEGYQKATVARITAVAGLSRAAFYAYFSSRREVFILLCQSVLDGALDAQRATGASADDPRAVVQESVRVVLRLYSDHAGFIHVMEQQASVDDEIGALWEALNSSQIARARRFFLRLQKAGLSSAEVDASFVAESMTGLLQYFGRRAANMGERDRATLVTRLIDANLRLLEFHPPD